MTVNEPKLVSSPVQRKNATPSRQQRQTSIPSSPLHQNNKQSHRSLVQSPNVHVNGRNTVMDDAHENSAEFRARATEITRFKVFARVRPFIAEELAEMEGQDRRSVVEMTVNKTVILDPKDGWAPKAQFEFDASLWSIPPEHRIVYTFQDTKRNTYATQRDVYQLIAKDLVPHVFDGFNSCILTYGHTGSGKTYTMMGIYDPHVSCGGDGEEGIIPRVSNDLFAILSEKQEEEMKKEAGDRVRFRVEVSFVEIYMERVRDLLDPALKNSKGSEKLQDARIRQDPYSGPFVEGVTKYQVENWAQCCLLLERGSRHRTTCATAVHNQSSRSHAIFQLTVIQEQTIPAKDRYSRPTVRCQAGRINLVDLAGSERGGFQDYVKESAAINTSLLALRRVIDNLTERQNILMEQAKADITGTYYQERPLPQVPFRDSVLTWLLSDSIGGNARTTMVATLSPLVKNYGDTLATLQWSSKARNLVTLVKVNDAQTTVVGGMSNKAGELHNAVRIQQQNMDSLHEALRQKLELAELLDREAQSMKRQMMRVEETIEDLELKRHAFTVLRAMTRNMWKTKLGSLESNHRKLLDQLHEKQEYLEGVRATKQEADENEVSMREKLKKLKGAEADLRAVVAENEATSKEFDAQFDGLSTAYKQAMVDVDADKLIKEATKAAEAKQMEVVRQETAARQEVDEIIKRADMMEAKIEESKHEQWRKKLQQNERDLVELRAQHGALRPKLDELKERRDSLQRELERKRKKRY